MRTLTDKRTRHGAFIVSFERDQTYPVIAHKRAASVSRHVERPRALRRPVGIGSADLNRPTPCCAYRHRLAANRWCNDSGTRDRSNYVIGISKAQKHTRIGRIKGNPFIAIGIHKCGEELGIWTGEKGFHRAGLLCKTGSGRRICFTHGET